MYQSNTPEVTQTVNWLEQFAQKNPIELIVDSSVVGKTYIPLTLIAEHEYAKRGILYPKDLEDFINPNIDEFINGFIKLKSVEEAVSVIRNIIAQSGKIIIASDYDVDGITSFVILNSYFSSLDTHIQIVNLTPRKHSEGYGLTKSFTDRIIKKNPNLVVFLDMGTGAHEQIKRLKEKNIEVIVIDHHQALEKSNYLKGASFINPQRSLDKTIFKQNFPCAGLLAYLFIEALKSKLGGNTDGLITLAAIATICDISPASKLNRSAIVK